MAKMKIDRDSGRLSWQMNFQIDRNSWLIFHTQKNFCNKKKWQKPLLSSNKVFLFFWFRFFFVNVGNSCANNVVAASVSFLQKGYN